jgi:hypothetical protein
MSESVARSERRERVRDNIRKEDRNIFAVMALFGGICSWVPLVIVVAFPLTLVAAVLSVFTVWRRQSRRGFGAMMFGLILAITALATHLAVASLGGVVGWIGRALGA